MQIRNPDYRAHVEAIFSKAGHVQALGITLKDIGPGWCETHLDVKPRHLQQTGVVHAGVLATLADHTAGAAGTTVITAETFLLTVEFKINLLRAASAPKLWCRGQVLKAGRRLCVAESEVFASMETTTKLVAKATVTMAVLPRDEAG